MTAILLLVPGIIAAVYYCKLKNIPIKSIDFAIWSLIFVFLINVFVFNVAYLRGHKNVQSVELFSIIGNAARYGDLGIIAAIAFPNIIVFLSLLIKGDKDGK